MKFIVCDLSLGRFPSHCLLFPAMGSEFLWAAEQVVKNKLHGKLIAYNIHVNFEYNLTVVRGEEKKSEIQKLSILFC